MSAKDELRNFIEALTPAQLRRITQQLDRINAALADANLPIIRPTETKE